jgi:YihY family inner membrane protein
MAPFWPTGASRPLLQVRHSLNRVPHGPGHETLILVAQVIVGTVSGFTSFSVVYAVVRNEHYRFSDVWVGAGVAAIGFELLAQPFRLYAETEGSFHEQGRRFALVLVLLAFFYFLGVITVLGAEINSLVSRRAQASPERSW